MAGFHPIRAGRFYPITDNPETHTPVKFLREFMHTTIATTSELTNGISKGIEPESTALNLVFSLQKPEGNGYLAFAVGTSHNQPAIIWEITIRSNDSHAPASKESIEAWLEDAHAIVEEWFLTLADGELIRRFKESPHVS